jgi:thiamine biosynthesis lipoprotein
VTARAWRAMGTLMEVRIPDLPRAEGIEAVRRIRSRVEELESAMTLYRTESPLVAFNEHPADSWMPAPRALTDAVSLSLQGYQQSRGAFDPTVAPAMRAWGLYDRKETGSRSEVLRTWRHRPSAEAVEVDTENRRLRRGDSRIQLDLGGIGKGIAADAALEILRAAGSKGALLNLGGSIAVLGPPPGRPEGWPVGIVHPRESGSVWSTHALHHGHLATSGDYERTVRTADGLKHHLLDPASGEPTRDIASVTVWGASGVEADVLSTARFVSLARGESLPLDQTVLALLERGGSLQAIKGPAPGVSRNGS